MMIIDYIVVDGCRLHARDVLMRWTSKLRANSFDYYILTFSRIMDIVSVSKNSDFQNISLSSKQLKPILFL